MGRLPKSRKSLPNVGGENLKKIRANLPITCQNMGEVVNLAASLPNFCKNLPNLGKSRTNVRETPTNMEKSTKLGGKYSKIREKIYPN